MLRLLSGLVSKQKESPRPNWSTDRRAGGNQRAAERTEEERKKQRENQGSRLNKATVNGKKNGTRANIINNGRANPTGQKHKSAHISGIKRNGLGSHLRPTINGYDIGQVNIHNTDNSRVFRTRLYLLKYEGGRAVESRVNYIDTPSQFHGKRVNGKKVKQALQFQAIKPQFGMGSYRGLLYALQLEDDKVMFLDYDLKKVTLNGKSIMQNV